MEPARWHFCMHDRSRKSRKPALPLNFPSMFAFFLQIRNLQWKKARLRTHGCYHFLLQQQVTQQTVISPSLCVRGISGEETRSQPAFLRELLNKGASHNTSNLGKCDEGQQGEAGRICWMFLGQTKPKQTCCTAIMWTLSYLRDEERQFTNYKNIILFVFIIGLYSLTYRTPPILA